MTGFVFSVLVFFGWSAWAQVTYPIHPAADLTPGALCTHPDAFRYPEKIPYCNRNVSTGTKIQVIKTYEKEYGYNILPFRVDFKIDHFIPLCMGGGNDVSNLWPQDKAVYVITDPHEFDLCQKLSLGQITQKEAVDTIKKIKLSLQ